MPKKASTSDSFNFEKSLTSLNELVEKMEKGNLPLSEALSQFEDGIKLIRECQQALHDAQQKVEILTEKNGQDSLEPFADDEK